MLARARTAAAAWPRALAAVSATLLAAALLFSGGSNDDRVVWIGGAAVLAAAAACAATLLGLLPAPAPSRAGAAAFVLLAAFLVWNAASVWWSIAPDLSWRYLNRGLAYGAFAVLGLLVGSALPRAPRAVAIGLAALLGVVVAWALAGKVAPALYPDGFRHARLRDPVAYWNALALLAAAALPLALWIATDERHRRPLRASGLLLGFAASVALLLTYSRGGVAVAVIVVAVWLALGRRRLEAVAALGAFAAPAVAVAVWAFTRPGLADDRQPYDVRFDDGLLFAVALVAGAIATVAIAYSAARVGLGRERVRRAFRLGSAGVAVLLLAVLVARADWVADQASAFTDEDAQAVPQGPERIASAGSNNRVGWWEEAWEAFAGDPVLGIGAGAFRVAHLTLRDEPNVTLEPHSLPLQFLAELGLVGFALAAAAAAAAALAIAGALRRSERGPTTALAVVALAYPLHALVDFDWDFLAVSAPFFFVLGALIAASGPVRPAGRRRLWAAAAVALGLAAAASLFTPWLADRKLEEAFAADDPGRAAEHAETAHTLNPLSLDPLLAWAAAEEARGDVRKAYRLYLEAAELQPDNWRGWYELGRFEASLDSLSWAELHLARARDLDPLGPAAAELRELDRRR